VPRGLPTYRRQGWSLAVVALVLVLFIPAAPSGGEVPPAGQTCPPPANPPATAPPTTSSSVGAAQPTPEQILACIGSEAITGASFSHWLTIANKSQGPPSKGQPAPSAAESLKEVMSFLISSDWVIGEARNLNIRVSPSEVRRAFDKVKGQQFPRQRDFDAFLRQSGQTVADLLFREQLNLLSGRIQRRALAGHHGSRNQRRALSQFVRGFLARWKQQTSCAPQYAVESCGHVQSVL
jgi:hypothetical protein